VVVDQHELGTVDEPIETMTQAASQGWTLVLSEHA